MPHLHHLAAAVCAVAAAACFRADVASCTATCATASDCPAGLACTGSGLCAESASTVCTNAPDAAPDATPGTLTVTVRGDRGTPAIGVRVLVARPDGTAVDDTTTDGAGVATVGAPGTVDVTVVRSTGTGSSFTTLLAAEPGDALVFGPEPNAPISEMQDVIWPTDDTAYIYALHSSCTMTPAIVPANTVPPTQNTTIELDPTCAGDHDLLITDSDSVGGQRHYLLMLGVTGPTITLTGTWQPTTPATANLQQLPSEVLVPGNLYIAASNVLRAGEPARGDSNLGMAIGGGGGATASASLPAVGAGREMAVTALHDSDAHQFQQIVERIPVTGEYNVSVEPAMLPWLTSSPVTDSTLRTVAWTQADAGPSTSAGDLIATRIRYSRGSTYFEWRIIGPVSAATGAPGDRELALPDLPGDEPFELRPTDTLDTTWLRLYGFAGGLGYAGVRNRAAADIVEVSDPFAVTDAFSVHPAITRYTSSRRSP